MLPLERSNNISQQTINNSAQEALDDSLKEFLQSMRPSEKTNPRKKRTKINIEAGQSVETIASEDENTSKSNMINSDSSSDHSEYDSNLNDELEPYFVNMYEKVFYNVHPIKRENDILTDEWVLVCFQTNSAKPSSSKISYLYYIGQVIIKKKDLKAHF